MERLLQLIIREAIDIVAVVSQLLSIHDTSWHFDWATKVEVAMALVICKLLELLFGYFRVVCAHVVVDRSCSGNGCSVRN